jgi:two-component system, OmpR family, KDP operon response regulator KdpE
MTAHVSETKERILVVDDEMEIRRALSRALSTRGFEVETAADGEQALAHAEAFRPDLIVLDLNLPELDGLEVCRRLRTWTSVQILVLSVREDESDKVAALDLGADDYLTKPFGVDELVARVRALLRRTEAATTRVAPRYHLGDDVEVDFDRRRVTREGVDVRLTRTEWALLEAFALNPGKLLTHRWLLDRVWGPGYGEDLDLLRVFVSQLRRKIEPDHRRPVAIATEAGVGYRWRLRPEPEVASRDDRVPSSS